MINPQGTPPPSTPPLSPFPASEVHENETTLPPRDEDESWRGGPGDDPVLALSGEMMRPLMRYHPRRRLARGGLGEVWDAVQGTLGRVIALKRLRGDCLNGGGATGRGAAEVRRAFLSEAMLTAFLEHPNIVPIYDIGRDATDEAVLAMKLIKGRPWESLIRKDSELPLPELLDRHLPILIDMTQAVAFAHSRGVVHLDLKPSQVMVGEFGEVLLMDWGMARVHDPAKFTPPSPESPAWRQVPRVEDFRGPAGTPAFMAPEQTGANDLQVGPWTDVFLLGATLYLLLTGSPIHEGPNTAVVLEKAGACQIVPPREKAPHRGIPHDLDSLCARALAPDPAGRVASAAEFLRELRESITGSRRREESRLALEEFHRKLAAARNDYQQLAECESLLERAQSLWFSNPAIPASRSALFGRYAQAAIDNDDLVLARRMATRLEDVPLRQELLAELEAREMLDVLERGELESLAREQTATGEDLREARLALKAKRKALEAAIDATLALASRPGPRATLEETREALDALLEALAGAGGELDKEKLAALREARAHLGE